MKANQTEEVVIFVHISDTHINQKNVPERTERFRKFCNFTLSQVEPRFVVHTGDIVDGRPKLSPNGIGEQQEIDWITYKEVLVVNYSMR